MAEHARADAATAETVLAPSGFLPVPLGVRPESVLHAGQLVDRYEVSDCLGAGGMGVVYRARDVTTHRDVALKFLRGGAPGTESCGILCSLLIREAKTMQSLSHPNILAVLDVGQFRGCVYVALEMVDGPTLREWAGSSPRTWRERLAVLARAGEGLAAAHRAGVFHRDFKPDNVLVARDGRVKVSDFGVARTTADLAATGDVSACGCRPADPPAQLPDAGALIGTPQYMSPEQLQGLVADARSDQFAFAVTAWETLHGAPPFSGDSLEALRSAVLAGIIVPEVALAAEIPAAVTDALRRALRSRPDVRYPSMSAVLERLAAGSA